MCNILKFQPVLNSVEDNRKRKAEKLLMEHLILKIEAI